MIIHYLSLREACDSIIDNYVDCFVAARNDTQPILLCFISELRRARRGLNTPWLYHDICERSELRGLACLRVNTLYSDNPKTSLTSEPTT